MPPTGRLIPSIKVDPVSRYVLWDGANGHRPFTSTRRFHVQMRLVLLVTCLLFTMGCGETVTKRGEPIDVSVTASGTDGKPLPATMAIILQPAGDTLPAKLTSKTGGQFTGKAMPGKYMYYIGKPTGEGTPPGVPAKHGSASKDYILDITPENASSLTIKLEG